MSKTLYYQRKEQGLCVYCGKEKEEDRQHLVSCKKCTDDKAKGLHIENWDCVLVVENTKFLEMKRIVRNVRQSIIR